MENENISDVVVEEVTEVTGANEQETAAPEENAAKAGEKEQEVTDPAGAAEPMSTEERHQQAQQRRDAQRLEEQHRFDAEVDKRVQERLDKFVAQMGKVNPKTGKIIETQAEYDEVQAEARRRKRETELKKAGIDPATIEGIINDHPDVKGARKAQAAAEAAKQHYDKLAREEAVREELRKIQKIDPNVKTPKDLMAHPRYGDIRKLIQENNHSISEAFDIATKTDREARAQARALTSAAAVAGSKDHMVSSANAGGADVVAVPADVAALYRKQYPGLSDDEIRAKYARYKKIAKKGK